jgi:ABC-2 type transport system permease protein
VSQMDTFLQNPLGNPLGNQPVLKEFPIFGAMQLSVAGGFTSSIPWENVDLSLAWFIGFAGLALIIFWWRTRACGTQIAQKALKGRATQPSDPESSPVHIQ